MSTSDTPITNRYLFFIMLTLMWLAIITVITAADNYLERKELGEMRKILTAIAKNTEGPQYLTYNMLKSGSYSVVTVINKHDGTALLRQHLSMGDLDHLVVGVPQGLLESKEPFQILHRLDSSE